MNNQTTNMMELVDDLGSYGYDRDIRKIKETKAKLQAIAGRQDKLLEKCIRQRQQLHEVREIYIGMEGFIPRTAPEGYCLQTIKQMYEAALPEPPKES